MELSSEQHEKYERDGYLIIDSGVRESVLDAVVEDLRDKYTAETKDENLTAQGAGRIQDAWRISENVKALALAPKILRVLEELYRRKALAFQTLNFPVGTEQAPHSDTIHFNSKPAGYMCGVWVALEEMDENNGTLMFYPGSHKMPEVKRQHINSDPRLPFVSIVLRKLRLKPPLAGLVAVDNIYELYEKRIGDIVKENNLQPAYARIKKGEALIWAANLIHGGAPHKDKSRTRHSQVTHYFFENCEYYTPLLSNEDFTQWRNPEWVS